MKLRLEKWFFNEILVHQCIFEFFGPENILFDAKNVLVKIGSKIFFLRSEVIKIFKPEIFANTFHRVLHRVNLTWGFKITFKLNLLGELWGSLDRSESTPVSSAFIKKSENIITHRELWDYFCRVVVISHFQDRPRSILVK